MTDQQRMYDALLDQTVQEARMAAGMYGIDASFVRERIESMIGNMIDNHIDACVVALLVSLQKSICAELAAKRRDDARLRDAALAAATVEELPPAE